MRLSRDLEASTMISSLPRHKPRLATAPEEPPQRHQAGRRKPQVLGAHSALLLPFLLVLTLPSPSLRQSDGGQLPATGAQLSLGGLLVALLALPFDRLRLESAGLVGAMEIQSKADLQEEETHAMLMAPAEHSRAGYTGGRATYGAAGQTEPAPGAHLGEVHQPEYASPDEQHGVLEPNGLAEPSSSISSSGSGLQARNDLPAVRALNVKCEKNHMTVNIVFDRPFYGLVFSKGHYNDQKCVHLPPNSGQSSVNFDIHLGKCGMSSSDASGGQQQLQRDQQQLQQQQQPNGLYIENTIIIQYDPQVQEIFDQARKLRCTWYDYYEKSVTFRPYNVDMLDAVTANFLGDNIQCWMQIQVGKGPWASEVAGIVKIGQTMTMVLAIKDDENRFDMLVRNCVAHDGKHQPIQLVDEYGCVARPKIMAKFQKVRNFGPAATVVSYAHFQAFKFPDSMSVHFQCVIQVCRYECPEPVCSGQAAPESVQAGPPPLAGPTTDYTASGTELVSAKEPFNQTGAVAHQALRLDESQGRVQVKLDTSMMAALGQRAAPSGPLPPHLLHTAASSQSEATQAQQPRPSAFMAPGGYRTTPSFGGRQSTRPPANPLLGYAQQPVHYSAPYPQARSGYLHRMGEGALVGTPRALRQALATSGAPNHRYRRATGTANESRAERSLADSTAIKTQRTIQVVSPDDVAFSLIGADLPITLGQQQRPVESAVCFSASRLLLAVLATMAALAVGIVIVGCVVLRQRAHLAGRQKLSPVFELDDDNNNGGGGQHQQRQVAAAAAELARQRREIQQRNTYLARLYSQFAPSNHWPRC